MINLHGLDVLNLCEVRLGIRACVQRSLDSGATLADMGAKNNHTAEFMRGPWDDLRFPWDWHWSTLRDLCDGAGVEADIDFWYLNMPETPLYLAGSNASAFRGVGALESLRHLREQYGFSYSQMGQLMGVVKSGVYKIECADDPKVSSIMRYARALGGRAVYRIKES